MITFHPAFSLISSKEIKDIGSTAYILKHNKTQAEILYLKNSDSNKSFTISFATPPYDDNGIAHIVEHSVLNGSRKFPSKEPFVELLKSSLYTFLNAMTYPDKTVYPVSSQNEKDLHNLMDVYLDAVFFPNFKSNPQILEQEGWHYHLENKEDDLIYKGVVYNEMKGSSLLLNLVYLDFFLQNSTPTLSTNIARVVDLKALSVLSKKPSLPSMINIIILLIPRVFSMVI